MNSILIGMLLATLGLASSWYYRQDAIASKAFYTSELAWINAESVESKRQSEERNDGIETQRLKDKEIADQRYKQLAKRQKPVVTNCTTSASGVISAGISDDAVRLLRDTANDPALREASDPSGFVGTGEKVTADSLSAYSFYSIEQYNQLAARYNALVEMVK
jgi:hypothetical protein